MYWPVWILAVPLALAGYFGLVWCACLALRRASGWGGVGLPPPACEPRRASATAAACGTANRTTASSYRGTERRPITITELVDRDRAVRPWLYDGMGRTLTEIRSLPEARQDVR